jgi:hypothetical protein
MQPHRAVVDHLGPGAAVNVEVSAGRVRRLPPDLLVERPTHRPRIQRGAIGEHLSVADGDLQRALPRQRY